MIEKVGTVSVYVSDQQRAKDFYVNKLGMELRTDAELYPGASNRWIAVAPKGAQTEIILYLPDENWEHYRAVVGKSQSITLETADVQATYNELKAKGVEFASEPDVQPWGTFATLKDSEGNSILLVQTA
jgi:lactoylglutathione lyase